MDVQDLRMGQSHAHYAVPLRSTPAHEGTMKEAIDLLAPIVDLQPIYNLGAVVGASRDSIYGSPEVQSYVRFKLRKAAKDMAAASRFINEKLAAERKARKATQKGSK